MSQAPTFRGRIRVENPVETQRTPKCRHELGACPLCEPVVVLSLEFCGPQVEALLVALGAGTGDVGLVVGEEHHAND